MKTILTTLNAKYMHTSLALRWLYVANKDAFHISFKEYVLKEDVSAITDDLLSEKPDIVGIGIYIWNVEKSRQLIATLKTKRPELIIIVGGPEVSYEPEFILTDPVDYVISGEGEFVLGALLGALENKQSKADINIECVSTRHHISRKTAKADLKKLTMLPSPYQLKEDLESRNNRIIYFETSRGCPYSCSYCLSSLETGMRYFPLPYLFDNLTYLINHNARQIKFLDRTFNLHKKRTQTIFDFLIQQYRPCLSVQFEIYADLLDYEMIAYLNQQLPPHYFRFEIGVQSTHEPTNHAIYRMQDFKRLSENIRHLTEGRKIDLHLDLIAGLPYETFDRFKKSFNDVFALRAKEVQLGFLKMLRGVTLRRYAPLFGYQYNEKAPYEIICHDHLTTDEIERIHAAEHALERYWNSGKFKRTMETLFETAFKNRYFELFDAIGQYYQRLNLPKHGYLLEDIFRNLHHFLLSENIDLFHTLREDYYACFKIRPHGFWEKTIDKKQQKRLLSQIGKDKDFITHHQLTPKIIEKQAVIDPLSENEYLLTIFHSDPSRKPPLFITYHIPTST